MQRCQLALQNVRDEVGNGDISLKSLDPAVLKQGEDIHNEVRTFKNCKGSEIPSYLQDNELICCNMGIRHETPRSEIRRVYYLKH